MYHLGGNNPCGPGRPLGPGLWLYSAVNYVDVGRGRCRPQLHRQMKMAASLTRDTKRQVLKLSSDSAAEIAEECVAIHLSVQLQLHVNSFR